MPGWLGAQWTDKATTTPVYIQDGFGPAGNQLAFDGLSYCFPTSGAMSLGYLGVNGFNQIAPANPTTADGLNLVRVLGGLMGTDPINGTSNSPGYVAGIQTYLAAKGISSANYTLTTVNSPTVSQLAAVNTNQTVIDLSIGFYDPSGNRVGGHCIALVSQGVNAANQPSPNTIVVNNPEPSALEPFPDVPANSRQYLNTVPTSGNITGDGSIQLDPSQYPGYFGTTSSVVELGFALTVNASQLSVNHPTPATWTLSGTQTINLQGGSLTVLAPLAGAGGLTKGSGGGVLELEAANTTTGSNTVVSGTLRSDVATGRPFGSGSIQLQAGTLAMVPTGGSGNVSPVAADGSSSKLTYTGGASILLNRNGATSLALTVGGFTDESTLNLGRASGTRGTLVIIPAGGTAGLGTAEELIVNGTGGNLPALTNGIVGPDKVAQDNDGNASGDFLTYGAGGFAKAAYT